jgi:hypothetical protein
MFRCVGCGSGYSVQAAATWDSCPRCLAKERVHVPLALEFGWRRQVGDLLEPDEEEERREPSAAVAGAGARSSLAL